MVVVRKKNTGTEIIGFSDVVHAGAQAAPVVRQGMTMAGQPGAADLERLEKYIVLADKGISLLGRAESIIAPIMARRQMAESGGQETIRYVPDPGGSINKEAPGDSPPAAVSPPAGSPPAGSPPAVSPLKIASTLRMIDGQAPGITALQIAELIEKNPEAVGRLMEAALKDGA